MDVVRTFSAPGTLDTAVRVWIGAEECKGAWGRRQDVISDSSWLGLVIPGQCHATRSQDRAAVGGTG